MKRQDTTNKIQLGQSCPYHYEETLVLSNLNSNRLWFHCAIPNQYKIKSNKILNENSHFLCRCKRLIQFFINLFLFQETMNPRDIMTDAIHNFHPQYQQYTQYSSGKNQCTFYPYWFYFENKHETLVYFFVCDI